jgi:hypothetical protein
MNGSSRPKDLPGREWVILSLACLAQFMAVASATTAGFGRAFVVASVIAIAAAAAALILPSIRQPEPEPAAPERLPQASPATG